MFSKSTTSEISPLKIKVNLYKALKQKNLRILFQMLRNYNLNFSLNVLRKLCGYFIIVLYKGFQAINCCLVHQNNYLRRWFGISFLFLSFFFFKETTFDLDDTLFMSLFSILLFSLRILYCLLPYLFGGRKKFSRVQNKPKALINPGIKKQFENN